MEEFKFQFEKLRVWNEARSLVKEVYDLLKKFPITEQYSLCNQLRRAVISVPSNIAEGNSRTAIKEQIHFYEIAFGSLMEVYCQLQISMDLGYITESEFLNIKPLIYNVSKMISGLRSSKYKQLDR